MSNFWSFLIDPQSQTGFPHDVLEEIYEKYCGFTTPIKTRKALAKCLEWFKNYNTFRYSAASKGNSSYRGVQSMIKNCIDHLFNTVNELEDAFLSRNDERSKIHSEIPVIAASTLSVDTFPIYINRPSNDQSHFYNGKYKSHILKVQVFVDNRGNIVHYSGPHIGCQHDIRLFYQFRPTLPSDERILADKAYCGRLASSYGIIAPVKNRAGRELTESERAFNTVQRFYRSRVEHAIGFLKRFSILSHRYRGRVVGERYPLISKILKILIHLNYMYTKKYPLRQPIQLIQ